jgi:hypothetical protein
VGGGGICERTVNFWPRLYVTKGIMKKIVHDGYVVKREDGK